MDESWFKIEIQAYLSSAATAHWIVSSLVINFAEFKGRQALVSISPNYSHDLNTVCDYGISLCTLCSNRALDDKPYFLSLDKYSPLFFYPVLYRILLCGNFSSLSSSLALQHNATIEAKVHYKKLPKVYLFCGTLAHDFLACSERNQLLNARTSYPTNMHSILLGKLQPRLDNWVYQPQYIPGQLIVPNYVYNPPSASNTSIPDCSQPTPAFIPTNLNLHMNFAPLSTPSSRLSSNPTHNWDKLPLPQQVYGTTAPSPILRSPHDNLPHRNQQIVSSHATPYLFSAGTTSANVGGEALENNLKGDQQTHRS